MRRFLSILCVVALIALSGVAVLAAASYDVAADPFYVLTVTTGADVTLLMPENEVTFVHLNIQDDGSTASVATDKLYIGHADATLTATTADGPKIIMVPGSAIVILGRDIRSSTDGPHEVRLRATGHGCKVQILRGR